MRHVGSNEASPSNGLNVLEAAGDSVTQPFKEQERSRSTQIQVHRRTNERTRAVPRAHGGVAALASPGVGEVLRASRPERRDQHGCRWFGRGFG